MTFQARETMVYEGQPRDIYALPLHNCERPIPESDGRSSGCWRGYQGAWELRGDELHLVRLGGVPWGDDDRDRLAEMFPEALGSVEATWFSGEVASEDEIDPKDEGQVATHRANNLPLHFVRFALIVHRGKLLSETATDLQTGVTRSRLTRHVDGLFPPDEVAFLRAIHADLDDRTARLVYADWLDDRNDPRGADLRREAARQQAEGSRASVDHRTFRQDIPTGYVAPEEMRWYWRRLADIPERTPEDREYRELLARSRLEGGKP